MKSSPVFLNRQDVLDAHKAAVTLYSQMTRPYEETSWIINEGLLESAIYAPQQTFGDVYLHESLSAMAGALWHSLVTNHPFADGNKRVGLICCNAFLIRNGYQMAMSQQEAEEVTLRMAAGQMGRDEALAILDGKIVPLGTK